MDLLQLKTNADKARDALDRACRPYASGEGRWWAYRELECGRDVPRAVMSALDAYHEATQAYYRARDGARGFLGGRGL